MPTRLKVFTPLIVLSILNAWSLSSVVAADIPVTVPASASGGNVVQPNFLGVSWELSFMDEYFGNDTSTIPPTIINYLSALRARTGNVPVRFRIGGNSMDSSTYDPNHGSPMVELQTGAANSNNQPVTYGPVLWDVMKKVADQMGGAEYLIGLSLLDPNNPSVPVIAAAAHHTLGDALDGYLLGNEPDLYTTHKQRPNIANYTLDDYINEFRGVSNKLTSTSDGNLLQLKNLGGPTICCAWDLETILRDGYLAAFTDILKYVSMQHYPQNLCFGHYAFEIPYYAQHANAVSLAAWNKPGITYLLSNSSNPKMIMSEFNSASCGGIPGISDTFVVGSLWTLDYALQMASIGYSAAYIHTRERGISYNLFAPPDGPNGGPGPWVTYPPYYAVLAAPEILQSKDGAIVADLNIANSMSQKDATAAGYAIYDSKGTTVNQIALFNFANGSTTTEIASFALPVTAFSSSSQKSKVTVKYLAGASYSEKSQISWGGESLDGVSDGRLVNGTAPWAWQNRVLDCSKGCSVQVPPTALAVVFVNGAQTFTVGPSAANSSNSNTAQSTTSKGGSNKGGSNHASSMQVPSIIASVVIAFLSLGLYGSM